MIHTKMLVVGESSSISSTRAVDAVEELMESVGEDAGGVILMDSGGV
jgi:hypothetical protein